MKLSLFDANKEFERHVEHVGQFVPAVVMYGGWPYLRFSEHSYQKAADVPWFRSKDDIPCIPILEKFDKPHVFQPLSLRWVGGRNAVARFKANVPLDLPLRLKIKFEIEATASMVINNVWIMDAQNNGQKGRRECALFCQGPPGTKLEVRAIALDEDGRLVADVYKTLRAIGNVPEQRLSLKEHLLKLPYYVETKWRML